METIALVDAAALFQIESCLSMKILFLLLTLGKLTSGYNLLSSKQLNIKNDNKMMMADTTNIIIENTSSEIEDIILKANTVILYFNFVSG